MTGAWHIRRVSRPTGVRGAAYERWIRGALPACFLAIALALPARAEAYDRQISLDAAIGWGLAPALSMLPNTGPSWAIGSTIGFSDVWGLGVYAAWATHPPWNGGSPLHVGLFGIEALYYLDILQVVPFFGAGVDVIPTFDEGGNTWGADFAAHLRLSIDYLVSREITIGADVRPYILFTNLSLDPVYLSFLVRLSVLLDY
jgi:hypothetical protein